ncbi:hypothetical protein [Streptosporangium sp. NBC_01756]|nr:hypothetical protein [Streptosporangium sp. NBC_01756]WSC86711.1 hypothetical protein OIE48_00350 [Streptosporangium sp. NBC_01756]
MSRDHAGAQQRFRCLHAEHVGPAPGFAIVLGVEDPASGSR